MAGRKSAGILLFRDHDGRLEVLIGHMGGPLWSNRDEGGWSIPKGEYGAGETPEAAARREFREELGIEVPEGELLPLGSVRQVGGKTVSVWAVEADIDPANLVMGTFTMEWPPRSGRTARFPELDRVEWFDLPTAGRKLITAQRVFLDRLDERRHSGS